MSEKKPYSEEGSAGRHLVSSKAVQRAPACAVALLALCLSLFSTATAQVFPTGVVTDADVLVAANGASSTLAVTIDDDDTTFTVAAASYFASNMVVVIGAEQIHCTSFSGVTFSGCTRGYDSSTPASHTSGAAVRGIVVSAYHNVLAAEIKAIETALGAGLANVAEATGLATAGAVPYVSEAGKITSDAAEFNWDATYKRLCVNCAAWTSDVTNLQVNFDTGGFAVFKAATGDNAATVEIWSGGGTSTGDSAHLDFHQADTSVWLISGVRDGVDDLQVLDPEDSFAVRFKIDKSDKRVEIPSDNDKGPWFHNADGTANDDLYLGRMVDANYPTWAFTTSDADGLYSDLLQIRSLRDTADIQWLRQSSEDPEQLLMRLLSANDGNTILDVVSEDASAYLRTNASTDGAPAGACWYFGQDTGGSANIASCTGPGAGTYFFIDAGSGRIGLGRQNITPAEGDVFVQDATPTTGTTLLAIRGGAGQGTDPYFIVRDNSGAELAAVNSSGGVSGRSLEGYHTTANQEVAVILREGVTEKWRLRKYTDDTFSIMDMANAKNILHIATDGTLTLQPTSGTVDIAGHTDSTATVTGNVDFIGASGYVAPWKGGAGAPAVGDCNEAGEVGNTWFQTDAEATDSSLFICANIGAATYDWEVLGASSGSGSGAPGGSGTQVQYRVDDSTFGGVSGTSVATSTIAMTGKFDLGGGTLEIPSSNSLPGSCVDGEVYGDLDASAGSSLYLCVGSAWVLQAGGGGSGPAGSGTELQFKSGAAFGAVDGSAYADDTITLTAITLNLGAGWFEAPNGDTRPETCVEGETWVDTDAPAGLRWYLCIDSAWELQGGTGTPGGSTTQFQYNSSGSFAGLSGFTWDGSTITSTNPWSISGAWTVTSVVDASGANLEIPNSTTLPTTDCDQAAEAGRIYVDTNATSGQQLYVCEGVTGWVKQGDGVGGGGSGSGPATGIAVDYDAAITTERKLVIGAGLLGTDLGANSTYTIAGDPSIIAFQGQQNNFSSTNQFGSGSAGGYFDFSLENDTSTGTTQYRLATLTSSGKAITAAASEDQVLGVVVSGAGSSGSARIAQMGRVYCTFVAAPTAGHFVKPTTSTAFGNPGKCEDAGTGRPDWQTAEEQLVGVATGETSGGNYEIVLMVR